MQEEQLLNILNGYKTTNNNLYVYPDIPVEKLHQASLTCKVPATEKVLGVIDCTVFGSASDAIIFGTKAIYYFNSFQNMDEPIVLAYDDFLKYKFNLKSTYITVDTIKAFAINRSSFELSDLFSIINEIRDLLKQ